MSTHPTRHELGHIGVVTLETLPSLSRDVPLDLAAIKAAWPEFEHGFDPLRGRRMMGLVYPATNVYRMSSVRLDRDRGNPLMLDETIVPGGAYLRLRLRGTAPAVYEQIADAFAVLFELTEHDPSHPHIESYRREGEVDCLVPTVAAH